MPQTYTTRQFQAGNSQAVRLPANLAFPPKTELIVTREGERIIVQPVEKTMESVPQLFAALRQHAIGGKLVRPEFVDADRNWGNKSGKLSDELGGELSGNLGGSKA